MDFLLKLLDLMKNFWQRKVNINKLFDNAIPTYINNKLK